MMTVKRRQTGFSLTEVLLATGVLAVGFAMIAMIFPVGIKLTSLTAERTMGPAIAEEALAKMRLYGLDMSRIADTNFYLFPGQRTGTALKYHLNEQNEEYLYAKWNISFVLGIDTIPPANLPGFYVQAAELFQNEEGIYPSVPKAYYQKNPDEAPKYNWAAIYRRRPDGFIQVFTFVCRRAGGSWYYGGVYNPGIYHLKDTFNFPIPVFLNMTFTAPDQLGIAGGFYDTISIPNFGGYQQFFTVGSILVDDSNGHIYEVVEKDGSNLRITGDLTGLSSPLSVWVVPPAVGSGRNPCIGVYEGVIGLNP